MLAGLGGTSLAASGGGCKDREGAYPICLDKMRNLLGS